MDPTPPSFHGFPVNTRLSLQEGDTFEDLEKRPILRVNQSISLNENTRRRIRYIISLNCQDYLNFDSPESSKPRITYLGQHGDMGIPNGRIIGKAPLFVILKSGYANLVGCTPVKEMKFDGLETIK